MSVDEVEQLRARNAELERAMAEMRARVELAVLPFRGTQPGGKRRNGKKPGTGG